MDFAFLISIYLDAEKQGKLDKVHWIYFSYEIDRISKEFKMASYFMYHDFGQGQINYKGKIYPMSQDYLMGKLLHRNPDNTFELVPVTQPHEDMLKKIYVKRIVPLFGEYSPAGKRLSKGLITFIEDPENPTGLYKGLWKYAESKGEFIKESYQTTNEQGITVTKNRITGYKPNDPDSFTFIITDHIRKLGDERGFTMKQKIDKWLEYSTWFRNMCHFTFIHIVHMNRGLANIDRLKYAGETIYPTGDDVKDSGLTMII